MLSWLISTEAQHEVGQKILFVFFSRGSTGWADAAAAADGHQRVEPFFCKNWSDSETTKVEASLGLIH